MYAKNKLLFVKQNINLQTNSILFLRNQAQLVQGTTVLSANTGSGIISVFQEGTSDNFDYNYWCSPIGIPTAAVGNNNFGITALYKPTANTTSIPAIILPQADNDGIANPLSIASRWIYKLTNADNYSEWIYIGGAASIAPGEGFTMKGTSGTDNTDAEGNGIKNNPGGTGAQRYDFRGKPNDGNITVGLSTNNTTLTGNPYPSALHLNAFLLDADNSASTGIAYFWEQDKTVNSHFIADYKGGYGSYAPLGLNSNGLYVPATFNSYKGDGSLNGTGASSGLLIERKYSPIGQGFTLNGASNGAVTIKNSHRAYYKENDPLSSFARPAKNKSLSYVSDSKDSYFKLNTILNNQYTRQIALAFLDDATDGVDRGIDALAMDANLPNDTYFFLEKGKYVIQGIKFDSEKKIPLGIMVSENMTLKFYISTIENFDPNQSIFIYDELDKSFYNIKDGMCEIAILKGTYNDRFKITFKNEINLGINDVASGNFIISQDNANQLLTIQNNNIEKLKSIAIYDMLGRLILSNESIGENSFKYSLSTNELNAGIYIVTITNTNNKRTSQKIMITKVTK